MRNLTKTIAAVSLLMPVNAYPLGIGEIKLHSALNQKLDAEIALLVSSDEDISTIKVKLASPDKFDEAGVPWSYFLSKIKFKAVTQANGSKVVRLSSDEILREPFLDFLLEVSWAKGNLFREFTVLVDPPVSYKKPTIPVVQQPYQSNTYREAIKPTYRHVEAYDYYADGQYGPVNKSDSLWKIAEKVNIHDDVSIEQMMMSIYEANPKAFYKKNVNTLKAGETLTIPDKNIILKMTRKQARAAFKLQDNVWRGLVAENNEKITIETNSIKTQLELEAPVVDEIAQSAKVLTDDTAVKKVIDESIKNTSVGDLSNESLALQTRMDNLEKQLVMMQKMLILKDEKIAALQNKKTLDVIKVVDKPASKVSSKKDSETLKNTTKIVPVKPAKTAVDQTVTTPAKPTPAPTPEVDASPNFVSLIIGGTSVIILGLLGFLWWKKKDVEVEVDTASMFASASEISLPDSSADELSIPISDDASYDVGTVGESSFLSEFTPSDFDAFDTDQSEVDPISEADVYLAYGRYQQAEELMVQAVQDFPERDECKLKLLEVYYTNENKNAFETYAKELIAVGKAEEVDFWAKVLEMGEELSPESTLYRDKSNFSAAQTESVTEESTSNQPEETIESIPESISEEADFDLSVFEGEATEKEEGNDQGIQSAVDETPSEEVIDFDLSIFDIDESTENTEPEEKPDEPSVEIESVEFDSDLVTKEVTEPEEVKTEKLNDEIESFDFDLGDEISPTNDDPEVISLNAEAEDDIDLETFDFSDSVDKDEASESSKNEIDDFDFDFDEPSVSAPEPVQKLDSTVTDLTDMDELETKLDLARAYVDMGDEGAAKEIADEILETGSDEQKMAAQEILDQLK